MPRGYEVGLQAERPLQEEIELQPGIAGDAWIGGPPFQVIADKVIDHPMPELLFKIKHIERNSQSGSDPPSITCVLLRTARAKGTPVGGSIIPHLHEDPYHLVTLLGQQRCRRRTVHSAAHGEHYSCRHTPPSRFSTR